MRTAYKVVAHAIAAAVVVQAALIGGLVFDILGAESLPAQAPLTAELHIFIGYLVIPVLSLALVVAALLGHAGLRWALYLFAAVLVQVALAGFAFDAPWVGLIHGANAFTVLALAEVAAWKVAHAPAHVPRSKRIMRPAV